jgi:hypothetical protein
MGVTHHGGGTARGHDTDVQHASGAVLLRLEQQMPIPLPVTRESEQERPLVAAARDMPDLAEEVVAVRARYAIDALRAPILPLKLRP